MIRLLIADDHPVVRDGLRGILDGAPDFEVLGQAADGEEAVALTERLQPDVVLMDLRMPNLDGRGAIAELARRGLPGAGARAHDVRHGRRRPARDRGGRDRLPAQGRAAHRAAAGGAGRGARRVGAVAVRGQPRARPRAQPGVREPDDLSPREREVLALVAQGATNREAARRLFISEATVKTHLLHIYAKLGVSDRAAAVAAGVRPRAADAEGPPLSYGAIR